MKVRRSSPGPQDGLGKELIGALIRARANKKALMVNRRDCSITRRTITLLGAPMSFMTAMERIFSMVKV